MNYVKLNNPQCIVKRDGTIFGFHRRWKRWIILKQTKVTDSNRYSTVSIGNKTFRVHQLVAMAFIPNPDNLPTVDHIDRDRSNNDVSNLRWASRSDQANNRTVCDNSLARYGARWSEDRSGYNKAHNKEYRAKQKAKGLYFTKRDGKNIWLPISERKFKKTH